MYIYNVPRVLHSGGTKDVRTDLILAYASEIANVGVR